MDGALKVLLMNRNTLKVLTVGWNVFFSLRSEVYRFFIPQRFLFSQIWWGKLFLYCFLLLYELNLSFGSKDGITDRNMTNDSPKSQDKNMFEIWWKSW